MAAVKRIRYSLSEHLANYLNEVVAKDVEKAADTGDATHPHYTVGTAGSKLLLFHSDTKDEKVKDKERKHLSRNLIKLGVGYTTTLGQVDKNTKLTIFDIRFKAGEATFKVNLNYHVSKLKLKIFKPLRFKRKKDENITD